MATMGMEVFSVKEGADQYEMVKITPPQTNDANVKPGMGAYCFVIGHVLATCKLAAADGVVVAA